ncbi:hypothetical protein M4I33_05105 [Clostridium sp. LY3-2]|uniref:hypothetical protein n=1 Tax=Clostridium sp. LY3-2 TaxID=2942482 RepID=UPI002152E5DB|nr:hypothetical protein [Clostridium sp. LY3-2]MCR6514259.1 hypothetical protein [Clostridium sp. LY3-2]
MKVHKNYLILIAGIVWSIAGFNIVRLGVIAYKDHVTILNIILSVVVFSIFLGMIFYKMVQKHVVRILDYKEKQYFYKFFDLKSYIIMAVMMGGGIYLRYSGLVPDTFIAFFYTGLGLALLLSGILFLIKYVKVVKSDKEGKEELKEKEA